jgi:hypothetical protein
MRWWLNTDNPKIFSVDNASVTGMDFSELLETIPDLWMVQWIEGKGELERQDVENDRNLNGLRESFIDITPYTPLFQQFLEKLPGLTLPQAKKIQIELIGEIYNAKRQAPFHYPVAAGNYWWDASDAASAVNPASSIQVVINSLNTLIGKVNALAGEINSIVVTQTNANIAAKVNANVVTDVNTNIVAKLNDMVSHINANIVTPGNAFISDHNTYTVGVLNGSLVPYVNNTLVGNSAVSANTLNSKLQSTVFEGVGITVPAPGLAGNIAVIGFGFPATGQAFSSLVDSFAGVSGVTSIAGVNWSTMPTVGALPGGQFVPIGATAPVTLTSAEIAGIQNGIAARTNDLNIKKNRKIGEVNALTTIAAVIVYDVTAGW